ncbi:MAG: hypothetical protein QOG42_105 [Solirubrobacteraceae bacterium]|nr:hypothetical protein [Solirubrobacteraceae bacterium]
MRALRIALLLAAGLLLTAAPAAVAGPGITFYPKNAPTLTLSGAQIAGLANLPARTYTLPSSASAPGKKVTLRGLTIAALLAHGNVSAQRVQVVNAHGGSYVVTAAQFSTAILSDDGITTRYFRSSGGVITDYTEGTSVALEVSVDGGDLVVEATASPKHVRVGERVRFDAKVRFGAPGATYEYTWDFCEGPVSGQSVSFTPKSAGPAFAIVDVRNSDPGCTTHCGGTDQATVQVGEAPKQPEDTTAGGANGTPGGAGSATGTGGGGSGGSGSGGGTATATGGAKDSTPAAKPAPKPESKPPPPPPKPFGTTISGVLINDTGTTVHKLPAGKPAGAAAGVRAVRGGDTPGSLSLAMAGVFAVAMIWVGALRERRGVRLRVA